MTLTPQIPQPVDWYERRDELDPEQVFRMHDGAVVKLDRRVPGDGSAWYVADWWNGWSYMDSRIEPGDLSERLADDFSGDTSRTPAHRQSGGRDGEATARGLAIARNGSVSIDHS